MRIILERRADPSRAMQFASPLLAIVLSVVAFFIIFVASGIDPIEALKVYFVEPLTQLWSIEDLIAKATPIILVAIGLCFCFRAGVWNIGAEGQLVAGAIAGSFLPIFFPDANGPLILPAMLLLGVLGGMVYAAVPAILKTRFGTNEILTSLMLVYVAQLFLDWLARGPWRNPEGHNFPDSRTFSDGQLLPTIPGTDIFMSFPAAVLIALAAWFVMRWTRFGFQIRVLGQAPRAGLFAGFSHPRMVMASFLISGALAGLAGICEAAGPIGQLRTSVSPGYGFTAIIVAFLGRLNPIGAVFAGLLLGLSYMGGEGAQVALGISSQTTRVFQGVLLFFVLICDTFILYRPKLVHAPARSAHPAAR